MLYASIGWNNSLISEMRVSGLPSRRLDCCCCYNIIWKAPKQLPYHMLLDTRLAQGTRKLEVIAHHDVREECVMGLSSPQCQAVDVMIVCALQHLLGADHSKAIDPSVMQSQCF